MEILAVGLAAGVGDEDIEFAVATGSLAIIGKLHGLLARGDVTRRSLCHNVPVSTRLAQNGVGALHRLRHGRCRNSTEEMCLGRLNYPQYKCNSAIVGWSVSLFLNSPNGMHLYTTDKSRGTSSFIIGHKTHHCAPPNVYIKCLLKTLHTRTAVRLYRKFNAVDIVNELAAAGALFTARLLAGEVILSTAAAKRMAEAWPEKSSARTRTHLLRTFQQVGSADTTANVNFFLGTRSAHWTN